MFVRVCLCVCVCVWCFHRTQYTSYDDGTTWSAGEPSVLTDNNNFGCEAALIAVNITVAGGSTIANGNTKDIAVASADREVAVLFFSEPTGKSRSQLTLRCSLDGGSTWPGSHVVNGNNAAAYSALLHVPAGTTRGGGIGGGRDWGAGSMQQRPKGAGDGNPAAPAELLVLWESGNSMIAEKVPVDWCVHRHM